MMNDKEKVLDVVTMGDLMLDFTEAGVSEDGKLLFERNPGGAPANVAAQVAALGGSSAFMGSVGRDEQGQYLLDSVRKIGICTDGIIQTEEQATRLTFVYLNKENDRYFSSYKSLRADLLFYPENVRYDLIENSNIVHFASSAIMGGPIAEAAESVIKYAKKKQKLISYDPNWNIIFGFDPEMRKKMLDMINVTDILKISDDEYQFFYPEYPMEEGVQKLISEGRKMVTVTLGEKGCYYATKNANGRLPSYSVKVKDTTGAGDSFMGSLLYQISQSCQNITQMTEEEVQKIIRFSCACGATSATKRGSLLVMPSYREVIETMDHVAVKNVG